MMCAWMCVGAVPVGVRVGTADDGSGGNLVFHKYTYVAVGTVDRPHRPHRHTTTVTVPVRYTRCSH